MLGPNRDAALALARDTQTMDKADLWRAANLRGRGHKRGKWNYLGYIVFTTM
jgi:hypothetical protein